jgi:hypothetical protein
MDKIHFPFMIITHKQTILHNPRLPRPAITVYGQGMGCVLHTNLHPPNWLPFGGSFPQPDDPHGSRVLATALDTDGLGEHDGRTLVLCFDGFLGGVLRVENS